MKIHCTFCKRLIWLFLLVLPAGAEPEIMAPEVPEYLEQSGLASSAEVTGWIIWSNDDLLTAEYSMDMPRNVNQTIRLEFPDMESRGYHDWSLQSEERLDVEPGQVWTASAWVKYENTVRTGLDILAVASGDTIPEWSSGSGWTSGMAVVYGTGDWKLLEATATVPPGADQIYVRFTGSGRTKIWIDDVRLHKGKAHQTRTPRPPVEGWAHNMERIRERLDRGLVVLPLEDGGMYIRWRLIDSDPEDIAFNVYRESEKGRPVKLNDEPVKLTTDFVDLNANLKVKNSYFVRAVRNGLEYETSENYTVDANPEIKPYLSIRLDGDSTTFQKIGIGDLNGDGRYDFVIKTPNENLDPWHWRPSETTYKLEAYLSDGTFLWRKDLGWNIETGIWYSPFVVFDFNGNGRAEIAVKTAPLDKDYREREASACGHYGAGRVTGGPEYISILDGLTGEEIAKADWPSRDGIGIYHHIARHQLGVAYLDGKTPSLIVARGTYTLSKLVAYQFYDNKLEELWSWDSTNEPGGLYYGQGDHFIHTVDLNGDGKDAIVLGAAVIDSNGEGLWSSGLGHPDNVWVGNIDPSRPGLEIYLGIEGARAKGSIKNGISLWDALTGEMLWGLDQRTYHIHGTGLCANIDSRYKGMECFSGEQSNPGRWLHDSRGRLIADESTLRLGLSPRAVYWDARPERELLVGSRIFRYPDDTITSHIEGVQVAWADILGDWREEIITSVPGELRIYTTPIPAANRRITLMQDPLYRTGVAHLSMGYGQPPVTSYYIGREQD